MLATGLRERCYIRAEEVGGSDGLLKQGQGTKRYVFVWF